MLFLGWKMNPGMPHLACSMAQALMLVNVCRTWF